MARIVVLQHGAERTAGRLGMTLRDHAFKLDHRRVDLPAEEGGDPLPPDLDDVHGLLVLGGPQSVDQNLPWMAREQGLIREAHERGLPVVGICLGAQMIAAALGGTVTRMETPEVGYKRVRVLPPGQTETILAGVPWESQLYLSHGDEISELPPGAQLLASSEACKVQVFRAGLRTYGFQFHFELDRPGVDRLAGLDADLLERAGVSAGEIDAQSETHYERFGLIADRLSLNLATYAFPFSELLAV